ncbi:MAG: transposase, partial [Saprospiraceae bacterium]
MTLKKKTQKKNRYEELSDFEKEAVEQLRNGDKLGGKDGILAPLIKRIVEASLEGELNAHLYEEKAVGNANRRNGKSSKTVKTDYGQFELETSRDRTGSFEPELLPKRQTFLGKGLDDKIISMYAKGMSYGDISEHLGDLYGLEISKGKMTAITDQVLPEMQAWRSRSLEAVYPIIWMDCIH